MKICQVSKYTAPAKDAQGAQRIVESLSKTLVKMGHEVSLCINPDSETDIAPIVERVPPDADIVHFHGGKPEDYGYDSSKLKWVTTSHGGGSDTPEQVKEISKFADHIIFVSKFCADIYNKKTYIHSSVIADEFNFIEKKEDYFLWIGGTDWGEFKGLHSAINLALNMNFKLKTAGGGKNQDFIDELKNISKRNNKIEYLGFVNGEEKAELIGKTKALLMIGQIMDACPLTSIEALACGTPIIARNIASHPEIIGNNAGLLCNNKAEIYQSIFKINKIKPIDCRNRFLENFTSEISAKKHLQLYEYCIKYGSLEGWDEKFV